MNRSAMRPEHGPDRGIDGEGIRQIEARGQGEVDLENAPLGHGLGQKPGGVFIPGEQDGPGRSATQAVEGRGTRSEADSGQMKKGILQESAARKDGQARRLVQNDDVFILVEDREFPRGFGLVPGLAIVNERVALSQLLFRGDGPAVSGDATGAYALQPDPLRGMRIAPDVERQDGKTFVLPGDLVAIAAALISNRAPRYFFNVTYPAADRISK